MHLFVYLLLPNLYVFYLSLYVRSNFLIVVVFESPPYLSTEIP